jgi:polar amino acid transport system substrate-binding protein
MKKRIMAVVLAGLTIASLTGCGGQSSSGASSAASSASSESTAADTAQADASAADAGTEAAAETDSSSDAADSDVAYIKNKGTMIVGITDFAPMDYKDDDGDWIGFDADLAKKVGEDLGVDVKFTEIDWDNKQLELDNKSIDVVWNGMTLTDEVKKSMECTEPYLNNAQVVVLPKDKADKYPDTDSMKDLNFAVEAGSAGEEAAKDLGFNYTSLSAQSDTLMEVAAGTSDASIIDLLMAGAMIGEGTDYPNLTHTLELTTEEYVVGARKGSDLASYLNDEFAKFTKDGTMESIAKQYGVQDALVQQ